tara:strand:- start:1892 stop:2200 length:309 start_codon:yes stop_codon:yes gene_type:complete
MSDQILSGERKAQPTPIQSPTKPTKQLVYRPDAARQKDEAIIRSAKTARLLRLKLNDHDHATGLMPSGSPTSAHRRTVQPGGFIRSRMTAELLGIQPGGPSS